MAPISSGDESPLVCAKSDCTCKVNFTKSLPTSNNPAPCAAQGDLARYWMNNLGNVLELKFPAVISTNGSKTSGLPKKVIGKT